MLFCLVETPAPLSRNRSASIDKIPVDRFSSPGVSIQPRSARAYSSHLTRHQHRNRAATPPTPSSNASRTSAAELNRSAGCFQAAQDHAFSAHRNLPVQSPQRRRRSKLDRLYTLQLLRIRSMKRMPPAHHLVQNQTAQNIACIAALAPSQHRSHISNRPATSRIQPPAAVSCSPSATPDRTPPAQSPTC